MIPLIPAWLHGWLDETILPIYLAAAYLLHLQGAPLALLIYCGLQHFVVTRITNYPRGNWPLLTFRTHAFLELGPRSCDPDPTLVTQASG